MQISLGDKIRELRRRDGRKQEELASALGVTSQAVSRWETDGSYPDLELIPSIANYFGISIDELFGYNNDREKKINELLKHSEELHKVDTGEYVVGGIDECIALLRDGLIEFPGNERIMLRLAVVLRDAGYVRHGQYSKWDENGFFTHDIEFHRDNQYWQEAIKLLEALNKTVSGELLYDVRFELLILYDLMGKYDKAEEIAGSFPVLSVSRQASMTFASGGMKRADNKGRYVMNLLDELANNMITCLQLYEGNFEGMTAVETVQNAIKIYDLIFTDGNYGRYNSTLSTLYLYLSSLQWRESLTNEAFLSLYKALEHAKAFHSLSGKTDVYYTAPLLRFTKIDTENIGDMPSTLADGWPWWVVPEYDVVKAEIQADPRWDEWVRRTKNIID